MSTDAMTEAEYLEWGYTRDPDWIMENLGCSHFPHPEEASPEEFDRLSRDPEFLLALFRDFVHVSGLPVDVISQRSADYLGVAFTERQVRRLMVQVITGMPGA